MYRYLKEVRRHHSMKDLRSVHREALAAVREVEVSEARLITCLQECERLLVYRFIGYGSLLRYAIEALELSRHRAHTYINVARKARELPAFQASLLRGEITVSKARRVVSVITAESCEWWLALLKTATKRDIELAVRQARKGAAHSCGLDRPSSVTLKLALSEELAQKLAVIQLQLERKMKHAVSPEEALEELIAFYDREDSFRFNCEV